MPTSSTLRTLVAIVSMTAGCTAFVSFDGFVRDRADASADGDAADVAVGIDVGADRDAANAVPDADADAAIIEAGDASDCPQTGRGPAMVRYGSFCIDSTEVTNDQYAAFLAAGDKPAQPSVCSWNSTFEPQSSWPPAGGQGGLPVVEVDWCDARAFCAWAGKRLCGYIGGGALATADENDPAKDQWFAACSGGGARNYPYGNALVTSACNISGSRVATGSLASCQGSIPGLYDMSGNVTEHIDVCQGSQGAADRCAHRGGHFNDTADARLRCTASQSTARQSRYGDVGIRCCGP